MLFSTALRLAAIECLCPTAAIAGQAAFPTLAGGTVFDSKRPEIGDLDKSKKYTPVVSIYSGEATSILRGEAAASNDRAATATLEFVAELAEAVPGRGRRDIRRGHGHDGPGRPRRARCPSGADPAHA
jgi:hypothetical protein